MTDCVTLPRLMKMTFKSGEDRVEYTVTAALYYVDKEYAHSPCHIVDSSPDGMKQRNQEGIDAKGRNFCINNEPLIAGYFHRITSCTPDTGFPHNLMADSDCVFFSSLTTSAAVLTGKMWSAIDGWDAWMDVETNTSMRSIFETSGIVNHPELSLSLCPLFRDACAVRCRFYECLISGEHCEWLTVTEPARFKEVIVTDIYGNEKTVDQLVAKSPIDRSGLPTNQHSLALKNTECCDHEKHVHNRPVFLVTPPSKIKALIVAGCRRSGPDDGLIDVEFPISAQQVMDKLNNPLFELDNVRKNPLKAFSTVFSLAQYDELVGPSLYYTHTIISEYMEVYSVKEAMTGKMFNVHYDQPPTVEEYNNTLMSWQNGEIQRNNQPKKKKLLCLDTAEADDKCFLLCLLTNKQHTIVRHALIHYRVFLEMKAVSRKLSTLASWALYDKGYAFPQTISDTKCKQLDQMFHQTYDDLPKTSTSVPSACSPFEQFITHLESSYAVDGQLNIPMNVLLTKVREWQKLNGYTESDERVTILQSFVQANYTVASKARLLPTSIRQHFEIWLVNHDDADRMIPLFKAVNASQIQDKVFSQLMDKAKIPTHNGSKKTYQLQISFKRKNAVECDSSGSSSKKVRTE